MKQQNQNHVKTSIVLLAAGNSTRFYANKLLHKLQDKPIIQFVMEEIRSVTNDEVIVVTQYEEVRKLANAFGFKVVMNEYPEDGISYSIKLAIHELHNNQAMFLTGDLAYIKAETLKRILMKSDGEHIICASHHGQTKNPVLFPRMYYPKLKELTGDIGGKAIVKKYMKQVIKVEVNDTQLHDVDTKEDIFK